MKEKLSHLTNLVSLIYQDGKLDKKELELLYKIAERFGVYESEIITMINQQIDYDFVIPENEEEKISQITDLIAMIMVDGIINPSEKELLYKIADKFGLSAEKIDSILINYKK